MAEAATELVVTTTRSSKGTTMTVAYKIGEADAVVFKTFNATEVAKASWAEYTVEVPKEAQVAGCKYIFTTNTASYYISQIEFVATGASKRLRQQQHSARTQTEQHSHSLVTKHL